jgi:hypothetical protein
MAALRLGPVLDRGPAQVAPWRLKVVGVALIFIGALFLITSVVLIYFNFRDVAIESAYRASGHWDV